MNIDRLRPVPPIKEMIGIDYVYRCGYMLCDRTIYSYFNYCPHCGTKIEWEDVSNARTKRTGNARNVRKQ